MRKRAVLILVLSLLLSLLLPVWSSAASVEDQGGYIRVGLAHDGSSQTASLTAANLANAQGSGYRFGWLDSQGNFTQVGYTGETEITMLKTKVLYQSGSTYTDTKPSGSANVIGVYHLELDTVYASFEEARTAAEAIGGFPAWIEGEWRARWGSFADMSDASAAEAQVEAMGQGGATVKWTTSNGVNIVATGSADILFQFDGGAEINLAVKPGLDDGVEAVTWFKGYQYKGMFQYIRNGANGNLTVVNWVPLETYVKGVIPYEMNGGWAVEALKAQAVCARTYAARGTNRHGSLGFDLCCTTHCQVYHGMGSSKTGPTANSDRAVEETAGICAWYQGAYAETYYYSSNGGATESAGNVWRSNLPYLVGKEDPYEAYLADQIPSYRWSYTFTGEELARKLEAKSSGYVTGGKVTDFYVAEYTPSGNVYKVTFVCVNGKTYSFSKEDARTILGVSRSSMHYTITGGSSVASSDIYINNGDNSLATVNGLYAADGDGKSSALSGTPYVITGDGVETLNPTTQTGSGGDGTFIVTGSGWGHNVGMSQWGAYSMALQGFTYDEILRFYYTGIELY